ncbi:MAG: riboflavin biosynthesis protein RibF [Muribaculaceae bacterium]|nr:riboflavin biosynthesis protein RibF [Muribaculaceae bacterium]
MRHRAAVIGTFDGVHLGHAAVLSALLNEAEARNLEPTAITFDRHPLSLIDPAREPEAITTTHRKEELIRKTGANPLVLPFDDKLRATTAAEWMKILKDSYDVELLVVGYDTTFGCDGLSYSISGYKKLGEENGIEVIEAPFVAGISSSAIRKAIREGDVCHASEMLGRHFSLSGITVGGNRLGRTIGFPTANIVPAPGIIIPANGVYAAKATLPDGSHVGAMVNIGTRPTIMRGNDRTVEAHLIGWEGDLYGKGLTIAFVSRLRDEARFNSIDALRRQLEKDRRETGQILEKEGKQPSAANF